MSRVSIRCGAAIGVALSLWACVASRPPAELVRVATFRGRPEVRFKTVGELRRQDLARGLPGLLIEGPPELALRASIVDDADGDGRRGPFERGVPLRVMLVAGGFVLDRESIPTEGVALLAHPLLLVEFTQEGRSQIYSRSIE